MTPPVQDRLAEALGWHKSESSRAWFKGSCLRSQICPIPSPDSDAALGFAAKVIREAGFVWLKELSSGVIGHDFSAHRVGTIAMNIQSVDGTCHDAADLMELAILVVKAKKGSTNAS